MRSEYGIEIPFQFYRLWQQATFVVKKWLAGNIQQLWERIDLEINDGLGNNWKIFKAFILAFKTKNEQPSFLTIVKV